MRAKPAIEGFLRSTDTLDLLREIEGLHSRSSGLSPSHGRSSSMSPSRAQAQAGKGPSRPRQFEEAAPDLPESMQLEAPQASEDVQLMSMGSQEGTSHQQPPTSMDACVEAPDLMDDHPMSPCSPTLSSKMLLSPQRKETLESQSLAAGDLCSTQSSPSRSTTSGRNASCGLSVQLPPAVSLVTSPNLGTHSLSFASLMPFYMLSPGATAAGCRGNAVPMCTHQTSPGPHQNSQSSAQRAEPIALSVSGFRHNTEGGCVEGNRESPLQVSLSFQGSLSRSASWAGLKTPQVLPQATTRTHLAAVLQDSSQSTSAPVQNSPKASCRILKVASPQKTVRNTLLGTPKTTSRSIEFVSPQSWATARVSPACSPQMQTRELGPTLGAHCSFPGALTAVRLGGGGTLNRPLASRKVGGPQVPKRLLRRRPSPPPATTPAAATATTEAATKPTATPAQLAPTPRSDLDCPSTPTSRVAHAGEESQPPEGAGQIMQGSVVSKSQLASRTSAASN